jgi:L-ribulose-5-phosphate 3-epimerase
MSRLDRKITRRCLLTRSAQAAALAALSASLKPLLAAPQSRWFKIGACDWMLGKRDTTESFDIAKQIGVDGIQVNMGSVQNDMQLRKPEVQQAYREAAQRTGVPMSSLAIAEMNQVPLKSDPRAAQWVLDSIDVCKALSLPLVMPAFFGKGDLDMENAREIATVVKALKEAAAKAEKQGVLIGLENWLSAEDNMKLIDRVGSPAVKVYYDVGNSTKKGRDIYQEIRLLGRQNLICEFHAKDDVHRLGQGPIDFKRVRQAMDDIGYSGWIQLESSTKPDVVASYTADRKFLKTIFPPQG